MGVRKEVDDPKIIELYLDGNSMDKIAKQFNVGPWVIKRVLTENGIETLRKKAAPVNIRKEKAKERSKRWAEENPDKIKASRKKWAAENSETMTALVYTWRETHPEANREIAKRYRQNHPVEVREKNLRWARENREKKNAYQAKRRALQRVSDAPLTVQEWKEVWQEFDGKCFWCKDVASCMDHIVPLTPRGDGLQGYHVKGNVVPACAPCNGRKHNKDPLVFLFEMRNNG